MDKRVEQVLRDCPGCDVHVLAESEAGDLLVLFVPPPADRAIGAAAGAGDWGRVTRPLVMVLPASLGEPVH